MGKHRMLIPVDGNLTVEQAHSLRIDLEKLLPDYAVILVGGMRGSAVILPEPDEVA